jgi:hypothetical protein
VREAITSVCKNIDSGHYPLDEKNNWKSYGIMVFGDKEIIDNPPPLKLAEPPKPPK